MAIYRGSNNPVSGIPISGSASAVSIEDTGGYFTSTNVEDALQELGDGTFDFKAANVSIVDSGARITGTDVEAALQELSLASGITVADSGGYFAGTDIENVLQEIGSYNINQKAVHLVVTAYTTDTATGDGQAYFHVPSLLDGFNLTNVHAEVITAGTTGTTDIQLHNVTSAADMLSTVLTIDSGETGSDTAAAAAVIDTNEDDVAENDLIRIDVDAVSSTAAKGLLVTLEFTKP